MSIIYLITNKVNNRIYIGQTTKTLSERWRSHVRDATAGKDMVISRAIREYGPENFSISILYEGETYKEELNILETQYIKEYQSLTSQRGYNIALGGQGGIITHDFSERVSIGKIKAKNQKT